MQTFMIFLVQTKGKAFIEMLSVLLGVAIIGWIVLWLCYKSFYTGLLKMKEFEINQLRNRHLNLCAEKSYLKKNIHGKRSEIAKLIKEINAFYSKSVHVRMVGQKLEFLNHTRDGKGGTFGIAHKDPVINLTQMKGIGLWVEEKHKFDLYSLDQVGKLIPLDVESIALVSGIKPNIQVYWDQVYMLAKKQFCQAMN